MMRRGIFGRKKSGTGSESSAATTESASPTTPFSKRSHSPPAVQSPAVRRANRDQMDAIQSARKANKQTFRDINDDNKITEKFKGGLQKIGVLQKSKTPEMRINRKLSARGTGVSANSGSSPTGGVYREVTSPGGGYHKRANSYGSESLSSAGKERKEILSNGNTVLNNGLGSQSFRNQRNQSDTILNSSLNSSVNQANSIGGFDEKMSVFSNSNSGDLVNEFNNYLQQNQNSKPAKKKEQGVLNNKFGQKTGLKVGYPQVQTGYQAGHQSSHQNIHQNSHQTGLQNVGYSENKTRSIPGDQKASVSGSISSSKRSSAKTSRSNSPSASRSAQRFINILPTENQVCACFTFFECNV